MPAAPELPEALYLAFGFGHCLAPIDPDSAPVQTYSDDPGSAPLPNYEFASKMRQL